MCKNMKCLKCLMTIWVNSNGTSQNSPPATCLNLPASVLRSGPSGTNMLIWLFAHGLDVTALPRVPHVPGSGYKACGEYPSHNKNPKIMGIEKL